MNKISFLVICTFAAMSTKAIADISIPPFKQIAWEEKTYKTVLPEPFGEVVVNLRMNESEGLEMMTFEIQGRSKKVDAAYLANINDPSEPEVTIVLGDYRSQSTPERFNVSFEYGVPQKQLISSRDECSDGCYEWIRKSIVITIDQNYSMSVEKYQQFSEADPD